MAEWFPKRLDEIVEFNPRETIKKGVIAKKIAMNKLQPFCRDITEFELEPFSGGTKFRNGDTIMARITPCLENGKTAKVNILDDGEVGFGSTEYIVFRAREGVDADFVYYLISSPFVREPAIKSMVGSSGRQRVQTDVVQGITVMVPTLGEQNAIAGILKLLDDKIAVNIKINKNLLEQAVAIFNNAIEQSTSVAHVELGSLADIKGGKRLPKGANLMAVPNSHPYIRVRDLNDVVFASLSANYEYVDDETQKTISRYITTTDDVLISIVGTIGLTAIVDKSLNKANLTENCVKVTNLHGISPEYLLLYLRSQHGSEEIKKGIVGAVQAKLPIKNIQAISVPLLPQFELKSLNDTLKVLFNHLSINVAESKCLADIRDSLLPKLMSGELDVSKLNLFKPLNYCLK